MASWKLCILLLLCVLVALVSEAESRRGGGRPGRGGRGRHRGGPDDDTDDDAGDEEMVSAGEDGDEMMGPGPRGGRGRGGRGRGNGGRRGGGRGAGGRGGRHRGMPAEKVQRLMSAFSGSVGEFSLNVYREMAKTNPDNFVFSPYSIHSAMSMLLLAAAGRTKRELMSGLSIRSPVHPAIKFYRENTQPDEDDEDSVEDESATLNIANKIYVRQGFEFNPRFSMKMQQLYNSTVSEFEADDPEDAVNTWVEENTGGQITDFLEDGSISSDMMMMLINAIYFKGMWKDQFEEAATSLQPFQVTESESVDVETMRRTGSYKVQQSIELDSTVIELPYEGDRFALFIVLPNPGSTLSDVESRVTASLLNDTLSAETYENTVSLEIPKFSLDTDESMKEAMQALGINHVFDPSKAKLTKMTRARNVFVNDVKHRAVIELDEEGTVASAATGIMIVRTSLPIPLKVNRPFMFVLRDKAHGLNLFMGRFTNPEGENLAM